MGGNVEMERSAPMMGEDDENKQNSKTDSRDNEEIS
jgi:hypothetical protein